MMTTRKVPQRTCVGCGSTSEKRAFIRFVRTPTGLVEVDTTGRASGRGAYLCASADCFEMARKRRRIDHALKVALKDDDYARLRRDFDEIQVNPDSKQGE